MVAALQISFSLNITKIMLDGANEKPCIVAMVDHS
jgi:hypothetical protein